MTFLTLLFRTVVAALLIMTGVALSANAQAPTNAPTASEFTTLETILQSEVDLTDAERSAGRDALESARRLVADVESENARIAGLVAEAGSAQETLESLATREAMLAGESPAPETNQSPVDLANALGVLSAERTSIATSLQDLRSKQAALSVRPSTIAQQLVSARAELAAINAEAGSKLGAADESSPLVRANALEARAERFTKEQKVQNLEAELSTISPRQPLLAAQISLAQAQIESVDRLIATMQERLASTRLGRADAAVQKAKADEASLTTPSPALAAIAAENIALAETLRELAIKAPQVEQSTVQLRNQIAGLNQSSDTVDRVIAAGRVSDELADVLRKLRAGLPKTTPLKELEAANADAQVNQQLNLILWQDRLRGLADTQNAASRLLGTSSSEELPAAIALVRNRSSLLNQLIDAANAQTDRLADQDIAVTEALATTQTLATQLDRRLLWLPSGRTLTGNIWGNLVFGFERLARPDAWAQAGKDFLAGARVAPALSTLFLLLPFLIFGLRGMLLQSMTRLADRVGNVGMDTYWTTPLALAETFLLALPLPLLIGIIGGIIAASPNTAIFSSSLATGLATVSSILLVLMMFRSMCRPSGLFTGHFHWSEIATRKLSRALFWFAWVQSIATFLFAVALSSGLVEMRYGLAVIAFIVASLGISAFNFVFFRPKQGIFASVTDGTAARPLLSLAFPLLVLAPLVIGLLPVFGFFDTATELQSRLFQSGIVMIVAAVIFGLLMRLYYVAHRRFALRHIRAQRTEAAMARSAAEEAQAGGEAVPASKPGEDIDPDRISDQTRSVLSGLAGVSLFIGFWMIWSPLLPALGIADDIVLWQRSRLVDGIPVESGVTLWNLILSIVFLVGGFVAARNIRGILEVGIFERMRLDAGERYAAVTILAYMLVAVGLVLSFAQLGIDWSKMQWIVAALGVGLGFGLQEIVANFISGLIILFERPVRVGDTVTIGTLSGTVSTIKIRATTITDFDNRDVLLPNKSLITENVTNWTLNDSITRLILSIGVAYGSNITQVRSLLIEVVEAHPDVLKIPPPTVFFMKHGDSSLDFELRIFVGNPAKRLPVTHEINEGINTILTQNSIDIPFPQRTIHMAPQSSQDT